MKVCAVCDGFGKLYSRPILKDGVVKIIELECELCNGTGKMKDVKVIWIAKGKKLREHRISLGLTLRDAAKKLGVDPSNLSKMERGVIKPKNIWLTKGTGIRSKP